MMRTRQGTRSSRDKGGFWNSAWAILTLVAGTSCGYMWLGPLPLWLWLTAFGGLFFISQFERVMVTLKAKPRPEVLCYLWMVGFTLLAYTREWFAGNGASMLGDRLGLNFSALALAVVMSVMVAQIRFSTAVVWLSGVVALNSFIALAQYAGQPWAWELPDLLSRLSSRDVAWLNREEGGFGMASFEEVGRVRGLDVFVHKFSAYHGGLAAFLTALALGGASRALRGWQWLWLVSSAVLACTATVVTFSRSVVYGVPLALIASCLLFRASRPRLLPLVMLLGTVAILAFAKLEIDDSKEGSRLYDTSRTFASDGGRIDSLQSSLEAIQQNPIAGSGTRELQGYSLVAHSVPVRVVAAYGLFGAIPYLMAWICLALVFLRYRFAPSQSGAVPEAVAAGGFAMVVVLFLDNLTHSSGILIRDFTQFTLVGVVLGLLQQSEMARSTSSPHEGLRVR